MICPRCRRPSKPMYDTRTSRSSDRPTGQPECHETPVMTRFCAAPIGEIRQANLALLSVEAATGSANASTASRAKPRRNTRRG